MRSFPYSPPPMTTIAPTQPHMEQYHHHASSPSLIMNPFIFFPMLFVGVVLVKILMKILFLSIKYWCTTRHGTMVEARRTHVIHNLDESVINTAVILSSVYNAKYAQEEFQRDCVICLNEFEDNDTIGTLPLCSHSFHLRCIQDWLPKQPNCPLCRSSCLLNTQVLSVINYKCDVENPSQGFRV